MEAQAGNVLGRVKTEERGYSLSQSHKACIGNPGKLVTAAEVESTECQCQLSEEGADQRKVIPN